jgi:hypothetical protein
LAQATLASVRRMFSASLHATIATEMLCMILRVSALAIVPKPLQSCSSQKPQKQSGSFLNRGPHRQVSVCGAKERATLNDAIGSNLALEPL